MDYFGISSPTFTFENDNFQRNIEFERVRDEFQENNNFDDIRNAFEKNQNFYNNEFSMEKKDTVIDGFGCQNENCNNREARFGTVYLPFCNENLICMKKNVEHLLLENAKIRAFNRNDDTEEYGVISMDIEKFSPKRKREFSLKKNVEPNPKRLFGDSY